MRPLTTRRRIRCGIFCKVLAVAETTSCERDMSPQEVHQPCGPRENQIVGSQAPCPRPVARLVRQSELIL